MNTKKSKTSATGWLLLLTLQFAMALVLFLSCRDDISAPAEPDRAIRLEMTFGASSRVVTDPDFASGWEPGDAVGLFAVKRAAASAAPLASADNYIHNARVAYTPGDGWVADEALRFPEDGEVLDFYAYYPYSTSVTDPTAIAVAARVDQDAVGADGRSGFDASHWLAALGDNGGEGYAAGAGAVVLEFRHVLAMVEVRVDDPAPILSVTLHGCPAAGMLDLTNTVVTPTGAAADIAMYCPGVSGDGSRAFRALVPPSDIAAGERPYTIVAGTFLFPAARLASPLVLTAGEVTRFNNRLHRGAGIYTAADLKAFADAWNTAAAADYAAGSGTTTARDAVLAEWGDATGIVRLLADIDMAGIADFIPIGKDANHGFTGTFDGGGHTISNLRVNVAIDYAGLFGYNSGTIREVDMTDATVTADVYAGGIAGYNNYGTITGCGVTGGTVTVGSNLVGGIAGYNNFGAIAGCSVTGATVTARTNFAGGIAGNNNFGAITGCSVTDAPVTADLYGGGIAGWNHYGTIKGCFVTGAIVEAERWCAGGIAGWNNSTITACIAAPESVSGGRGIGICAGHNEGSLAACYHGNIDGLTAADEGDGSGSTGFDKSEVRETGNFFTAGIIARMNEALVAAGVTDRQWTAGNAASGWYPVIE